MKIRYINHACFTLTINGIKIVIDPNVSDNEQAEAIKDSTFALITHGHSDHLSGIDYLNKNTTIITNFELSQFLNQKFNTLGMNFGGEITLNLGGENVKISMVEALHTSSYTENGHTYYAGNPCGYIIRTDKTTLYYMGDTDIFSGMKLICDYYKPDIILMPIGNHYTIGTDKAIYAINNLLKAERIIPMHYNYVTQKHYPIDITKKEMDNFIKRSAIKVDRMNIMQEIEI